MTAIAAPAKVNLALVVGPLRPDGKHEVVTLMEQLTLEDTIDVEPAPRTEVVGFAGDTIVGGTLAALADAAGHDGGWRVTITKRIPVAAGLGGGSADAAAALRLANGSLRRPLGEDVVRAIASRAGADVPFFLRPGPQLGTGDGSETVPVDLPGGYAILLVLPHGAAKESTGAVYRAFDERRGDLGFDHRREALLAAVDRVRRPVDLGGLPPNDLASSPLAERLVRLGAFRADVSGAGPTVYGLFDRADRASRAADALAGDARTWVVGPRRV